MDVVKSLTSTDVTIVSTIHNPTTHAFSLFDELLMLIHGHVAYFGPCGTPLVDYMQQYLPLDILQVKRGVNWLRPCDPSGGVMDPEWFVAVFTDAGPERSGRGTGTSL